MPVRRDPRLPNHGRNAKVKVVIYMTAEEHRALKVEAAERGKSMGDVVIEALMMRGGKKYYGPVGGGANQ